MNCKNCNHTIPNDSEFCPFCGTAIEAGSFSFVCQKCGHEIPEDSEFCPFCGETINNAEGITICKKCGKPLLDDAQFCKFCGTKRGVDPKQRICKKCGKPITDDSDYCPYCGAKNKNHVGALKKRKKTIIVVSAILIAVVLFTLFAAQPIYQSALQATVNKAVELTNQRKFTDAYSKLMTFEQYNHSSYGLDTNTSEYKRLKRYIEAGVYYERGEYAIAYNMFNNLGDYRASKILAEDCNRLK